MKHEYTSPFDPSLPEKNDDSGPSNLYRRFEPDFDKELEDLYRHREELARQYGVD
jgi:hypothetical protein